jgi:hypothetical protein
MADVRATRTDNVTLYDESGNQVTIALGGTPTSVVPVQGAQPAATSQTGVIATGALTAVSVVGYNVATVTLRTFTGTAPSITYKIQASDDNTNWVDLQGTNNSTGVVGTSFTQAAALTAGTAGPSVDYTVGAYTQIRVNVTAISGTTPSAAFGVGVQSMPYEATPAAIINGFDGTNYQRVKTDTSGNILLGTTTNSIGLVRQTATTTSSGLLVSKILSAATTNATNIKASAGQIFGWHLVNTSSAVKYFRIYNLAVAPTVGTSSPSFVLPLPASGGAVMAINPIGMPMTTGISYAITGAAADLDATAVAANDVIGSVFYI